MQLPALASTLGRRFFLHIGDLCALLAQVSARHRALSPLLVLAWFRLRRMALRLDRLAARHAAGRLRPPVRRSRAPTPRKPVHPAEAWLPRRLPRGQAWLIRLHQPLAQLAPRADMLLHDPEIAALCQAAPQAGRLLRPLATMFGLPLPPHLARPPRPPRPPKPRPRKPPPPVFPEHSPSLWPYVPLRLRLRVPGLPRRREAPD